MLKIEMPRKELSIAPQVTVGDRKRYSTATAIAFISEDMFVSAAFNSKTLYLVQLLPDGAYKILDIKKTRHSPDLMKYQDGLLLTSDYPYKEPDGHASLYRVEGNKIRFIKEIRVPKTKVHGCWILDPKTIMVTSNSDHNRGLLSFDVDTGRLIKNFSAYQHYPKDVCVDGDFLFIVTSVSLPQIGRTTVIKESILYVFDKNTLEKIDEVTFHGQTDSIAFRGGEGFITVQGDDSVVCFAFSCGKLSILHRVEGFSFPHGISVLNSKVAVTNYGDNSIRIFDRDELKSHRGAQVGIVARQQHVGWLRGVASSLWR